MATSQTAAAEKQVRTMMTTKRYEFPQSAPTRLIDLHTSQFYIIALILYVHAAMP